MPLNPPQTTVRTSHAITIKTADGTTIGMIKQWNPAQTRKITPVYEINAVTSGDPVENLPGNVEGLTVRVQRYDLYTQRMEQAFGSSEINWLSDQDRPFTVQEHWRLPDNSIEAWIYTGCWFSSVGRNYQSDDARIVLVDGAITYLRKNKLQ
jgi:hypothetical protein